MWAVTVSKYCMWANCLRQIQTCYLFLKPDGQLLIQRII